MVGIISDNFSGLTGNSLAGLGQRGLLGAAGEGKANQQVYVNVASGNLVFQGQDDFLASRGNGIGVVRTYNSQGTYDNGNGDAWWRNGYHSLINQSGVLNQAGSSIQRVAADGSILTYTYDAESQRYLTVTGSGQFDSLSYDAASNAWTWTQSGTQNTEAYTANGNQWRMTSASDLNGNTTTYAYTGDLLTSITDASGERIRFTYQGNLLSQEAVEMADGTLYSRVSYSYDSRNRLEQVIVDLSPSDNSTDDGNFYFTSFSYVGDTNLISSISQADGSQLSFTYTTVDGRPEVESVTDFLGRTFSFSYDPANHKTTVTDPYGNQNVYTYDANHRLTEITGPQVGGIAQHVQYAYDSAGNLIQTTDAQGNKVQSTFDANGNLLTQTDSLGNRIEKRYDTKNRLIASTRYQQPATVGQAATEPLTTRYVYDSNENLRFAISPEGRVVEYRYDAYGQKTSQIEYPAHTLDVSGLDVGQAPALQDMTAWASAQDVQQTTRTDYQYNARGQVVGTVSFAHVDASGLGIADGSQSTKAFAYDATGNLLLTIDANGNQTSYTYDGLNRLLSSTDAAGNVTVNQYDDDHGTVTHTLSDGRVETRTYDYDGRLLSTILGGQAQSRYRYDGLGRLVLSKDPTGGEQHYIYDAAGNLQAEVDGTGHVTSYVYNDLGQRVQTIRYATPLTLVQFRALDAGINASLPRLGMTLPQRSPGDQVSVTLYDAAGRVTWQVNAEGDVVHTQYDGASRVTAVTQLATRLDTALLSNPDAVARALSGPVGTSDDRTVNRLYDKDGLLRATIDGAGFLTEYRYNAAGQRIQSIAYAQPVAGYDAASGLVALRAAIATASGTGSLASLLPAGDAADIRDFYYYDGHGRLVGHVDGEGYLTESVYDANGNLTQSIRYANRANGPVGADSTLDGLRPARSVEDQISMNTWDGLNRLKSQTNTEGTVAQYAYDSVGHIVSTVTAAGSADQRTVLVRYDALGRVSAQLSARGAALITGSETSEQLEAIWSQYATQYSYDEAGRRISATDPNGNQSLFYYDSDGRLLYTVNALGEVQERQYDAFGNLASSTSYGARLSADALAGMQGGVLNGGGKSRPLEKAFAALKKAGGVLNSTTRYTYNAINELVSTTDANGGVTTTTYDVFGEVVSSTQSIDGTHSVTTTRSYDRRGLRTEVVSDAGGANVITRARYDAFGRLIESVDGNGNVSAQSFDRLGRIVQTQDPTNAQRSSSYDAFGRVLSQTDALGHTTHYSYSAANRSLTVTTPEGVSVTTVHNAEGQTHSVTDGNGNTTVYSYDADGNLVGTASPTGQSASQYDQAGRLIETIDANGNKVDYTYDATNRLLSRTVDPNGLNLVTRYQYDAKGERISTTDANGTVTQIVYDPKGQVVSQTVDPNGLNLTTTYTYDDTGHVLSVTDPKGITTQYVYDALGRRVASHVDPRGLDITRRYAYDTAGNVVASTDGNGSTTRYIYDADHRLVYTIDAAGDVQQNGYDAEGRLVSTTAYANRISLAGLGDAPALAEVAGRISADAAHDHAQSRVYDADGRLRYTVDGAGGVVSYTYDANGNVVDRVAYANAIPAGTPATQAALAAATAAGADAARDVHVRNIYDSGNRLVYTIDATGDVQQNSYDAEGRLVGTTAYANRISLAGLGDAPTLADVAGRISADAAHDHAQSRVYDADGRLRYTVDGAGGVVSYTYDANGNVVDRVAYTNAIPAGTPATQAALAAATAAGADAARDVHVRNIYDAGNRLVWSADGTGAVVQRGYDANGNLVRQVAYANRVDKGASPDSVVAGTGDRVTLMAYDSANRLTWQVDAMGGVTHTLYDANGNVAKRVAYSSPIAAPLSSEVPRSEAAIASAVLQVAEGDRVTRFAYDAANRQVLSIDSQGGVVETRYDADGNAVATVAYANRIQTDALDTVLDPQTVFARLAPDALHDRVTQRVFDTAGRQIYAVDALGFVQQTQYDGAGRIVSTTAYAHPVSIVSLGDGHAVADRLSIDPVADRTNTFIYDSAGHLIRSTDPMGAVETYTWNGVGDKLSYTNKNGATWTYQYDAAGRLVAEFSPPVSSVAVKAGGDGGLVLDAGNSGTAPVVTRLAYDALGNLISRTEAAGRPEERTTQYRYDAVGRQVATIYPPVGVYRDPRFRSPLSDEVFDDPLNNGASYVAGGKDGAVRVENVRQLTTQVVYDAFGDAVASIDAAGSISYKTYDVLGHVAYEVDALGFVTGYKRNVFGEVSALTRYGMPIVTAYDVGIVPGSAQVVEALSNYNANYHEWAHNQYAAILSYFSAQDYMYTDPADRTVSTEYDQLGRVAKVTQPATWVSTGDGVGYLAAAVTQNTYDAFGDLVQSARLADLRTNTWATTTYYFDQNGRQTATIDAMGYVTSQAYDAAGNVVQRTEYANAAPGWTLHGWVPPKTSRDDRTTVTAYDRSNRKISETRVNVEFSSAPDGSSTWGNLTKTYGYDAVGNLTRTTNELNNSTYTYYDALGRILAQAGPTRSSNGTTLTPLTTYARDALGNAVIKVEHALGAASASEKGYILAGSSEADRISYSEYDSHGNVLEVTDANRVNHYYSYDELGHVAKQWMGVTGNDGITHTLFTIFEYDRLGRQTGIITPASIAKADLDAGKIDLLSQDGAGTVRTSVVYNAFGEVILRGTGGLFDTGRYASNYQFHYDYDVAGHLWRTNDGDGLERVYLYNLLGQQTVKYTDSDNSTDPSGHLIQFATVEWDSDAQSVDASHQDPYTSGTARTINKLDLLGRVVHQTMPGRWTGTHYEEPSVYRTFDRWGNVVSQSDIRNTAWVTLFAYNANNQLVSQTQPDGSGGISGDSPVTQIYYDALGRQVAVRDGNGNVNGRVWDATGDLIAETHADAGVVTHGYDAFGDRTWTSDAMGYMTQYAYDKLGRNTAIVSDTVGAYKADSNNVVTGAVGNLVMTMAYDQAGRKLWERNGNGELTQYTYDLQGNVIATTQPMGEVSRSAFDSRGHQVGAIDANGSFSGWEYDALGRLSTQKIIGGVTRNFTYTYNAKLASAEVPGINAAHLSYDYDAAGQLIAIYDRVNKKSTTYSYNLAGQRIKEETVGADGSVIDSHTLAYDTLGRLARIDTADGASVQYDYDKAGNRIHQRATWTTGGNTSTQELWYAYDSMNRQILVDGAANGNGADLANIVNGQGHILTYDKNGNRTSDTKWGQQVVRQVSVTSRDDAGNPVASQVSYVNHAGRVTEFYTYDRMNRLSTVSAGAYDEGWNQLPAGQGIVLDTRLYDGASRLVESGPIGSLSNDYVKALTDGKGDANGAETRVLRYDGDGRLLNLHTTKPDGSFSSDQRYDFSWESSEQVQTGLDDNGAPVYTTRQVTHTSGYDAAGNVLAYQVVDSGGVTSTYSVELGKYDGYRQMSITGRRSDNPGQPGKTTFTYDVNGYLTGITELQTSGGGTGTTPRPFVPDPNQQPSKGGALVDGSSQQSESVTNTENDRTFVLDALGNVLQKIQGGNVLKQLVVNGQVMGTYGVGVDLVTPTNAEGKPNFTSQNVFNLTYQPITNVYPAASMGLYQVQAGDTLRGIAQAAYGDADLWYQIADANGLRSDADLRVGQTLTIPNRVNSVHNASTTFGPYNPAKIIGNTSPALPVPQQDDGGGCGGIGMILAVVVAVVATVFTAGAAAVAMAGVAQGVGAGAALAEAGVGGIMTAGGAALTGGIGAGAAGMGGAVALGGISGGMAFGASAIGGAVGSAVSQGFGMAIGQQDQFNWDQVALSAVGAAVASGVGAAGTSLAGGGTGATNWAALVARAAIGSTVSQGLEMSMGLQHSFSWAEVAAAAGSGLAGAAAGEAANSAMGYDAQRGFDFGKSVISGTAAGIASGTTTAVMRGGRVQIAQVATDAFGNALGQSLASNATSTSSTQEQALQTAWDGTLYGAPLGVTPSYATRQSIFDAPLSSGDGTSSMYGVYGAPVQGSFGDGTPTSGVFASASAGDLRSYVAQNGDGPEAIGRALNPSQPYAAAADAMLGAGVEYSRRFNRMITQPGTQYTSDLSQYTPDQVAALDKAMRTYVSAEAGEDARRAAVAQMRAVAAEQQAQATAQTTATMSQQDAYAMYMAYGGRNSEAQGPIRYSSGASDGVSGLLDRQIQEFAGTVQGLAQTVVGAARFVNDQGWVAANALTGGWLADNNADAAAAVQRNTTLGQAIAAAPGAIASFGLRAAMGNVSLDEVGQGISTAWQSDRIDQLKAAGDFAGAQAIRTQNVLGIVSLAAGGEGLIAGVADASVSFARTAAMGTRLAVLQEAEQVGNTTAMLDGLASRNVWRDFAGQGVDLGGGAYGPTPTMVSQVLDTGGSRAQALAEAIRSGDVSVIYSNLKSGISGRYFPGSNEIELNANMNWSGNGGLYDAATTVAHEGQHWMDDVAGIATKGMKSNEMYFEARAFLAEQRFADSVGMPQLGTIGRLEQKLGSRSDAWGFIKNQYGY
ncbi:LysM peptidoglycan-binding domain-containing protein [Ralstonia pseudosolanacearum]|uniref:LysM peptidoglycan-binding domain-containing protein n=1 Tax=Ralstonia pseudosolanacearum TaxID=1310165 RepID=UPI003AAC0F38